MSQSFTKEDRKFLRAAGITTEPPADSAIDSKRSTAWDEERLALAKRIAKHQAPVQVKVDPNEARLQLIKLALQKLLDAAEARDTGGEQSTCS